MEVGYAKKNAGLSIDNGDNDRDEWVAKNTRENKDTDIYIHR